jgi:hypothetical protein
MNVGTSKNNSFVRMPVEVHIWVAVFYQPQYMAFVRFEVTVAATLKIAVVWAVTPCSLVEILRRLEEICRQQ